MIVQLDFDLYTNLYFLATKIFHPGIVIGATGFSIFNPALFCHASISGIDQVPDELVNEK